MRPLIVLGMVEGTVVKRLPEALYELNLQDETAWLEEMARLAAAGRHQDMDFKNLSEYLADMAIRDRREVLSRLRVLITYLLKWDHQPKKRTKSRRSSILTQRHELQDLLESRTLLNHAKEVLPKAYQGAIQIAATETGLATDTFPKECPYTIDDLLAGD